MERFLRNPETVIWTYLVIIHDLNVFSLARVPDEADPVLIVDANTVPPGQIAPERFQSIGGWCPQIVQAGGRVEHVQLAAGHAPQLRRASFACCSCIRSIEHVQRAGICE